LITIILWSGDVPCGVYLKQLPTNLRRTGSFDAW
jgi:hypothetical protein